MAYYLATSTQLFLYSCHEWPIGQCKNLNGDIVPGLTKLARGFSVVSNHHKLVAVASYHLKIIRILIGKKIQVTVEWGR